MQFQQFANSNSSLIDEFYVVQQERK